MSEKKRYAYFDYLSIAACIAVLYMHHNGLAHHYEKSAMWLISMGIECLCFWAVPVFFMISGAKLMNYRERHTTKEFIKRRIEKVVIPWLAWSAIFLFLQVIKGSVKLEEVLSIKVVSLFLNTEIIGVYWFFPALISVYLCIPVLSAISKSEDGDGILKYIVGVTFITTYCLPWLFEILRIEFNRDLMFPLGGGYILWAILGYLLNKVNLDKKKRSAIYIVAIVALVFRYVVTVVVSCKNDELYEGLFDYNQFHTVFLSMGIFVFFKYHFMNRCNNSKWVVSLASSTYGVYLLHIFVEYQIVEKIGLLKGYAWMGIAPLVTGTICFIMVIIVRKIPIARKLIP